MDETHAGADEARRSNTREISGMATEFTLPDLGEGIASGDVVSVLVAEGDVIQAGQGVIEMETDKAVAEVPCPHGGRVATIHVAKGDTVEVGAPLLTIEESAAGADPGSDTKPELKAAPAPSEAPVVVDMGKPRTATGSGPPAVAPSRKPAPAASAAAEAPAAPFTPRQVDRRSVVAGPGTRRLARELGVHLDEVEGTGPGGRITKADVGAVAAKRGSKAERTEPAAASEHDRWGPVHREPLTQIRKAIAARMVKAATTIPHVTHCDDADVTELDHVRRTADFEDLDPPVKVTLLPFVMKALCHTLKNHPAFNASFDDESQQVIYKDYVSLGVAVDTDRGLIVPVIRNVDEMDILSIAYAVVEAANRVKSSRFDLDELRGGTFTISNVGAYGGSYSTPIINHPESAILLVGRGRMTPVYNNGSFEPRMMLPLSLSYDHRVIDGAMAAKFMRELIWYLESPGRLLLLP